MFHMKLKKLFEILENIDKLEFKLICGLYFSNSVHDYFQYSNITSVNPQSKL